MGPSLPSCRRCCIYVLCDPRPAFHQFNVKVLSSEYAKYYFHLRYARPTGKKACQHCRCRCCSRLGCWWVISWVVIVSTCRRILRSDLPWRPDPLYPALQFSSQKQRYPRTLLRCCHTN